MLMKTLTTSWKVKSSFGLHKRTAGITLLLKTFMSSQKLPQAEVPGEIFAASTRMKKIFEGHDKSSQKTRTRAKRNMDERPTWFDRAHPSLIKDVVFPPKKDFPPQLTQEVLRATSVSDLMSLARSIEYVDQENMKIIVALWRHLDSMTVEEILTTADIFYMNKVSVPSYSSALITYFWEMFDQLSFTPLQLTRLAFHIKNYGSAPPPLFLAIEEQILEKIDDFNINQLAALFQFYFTLETRVKSHILVDKIASKLLQEIDLLKSWYLPVLMKTFRFSNYLKISFYKELGNHIISTNYFKNFHTSSQVMHVAFTFACVCVTHPDLFHYTLMHCERKQHIYRLKDLSKIIWACGSLGTDSPRHLQSIHTILNKLRKDLTMRQIQEYPDNLADLLLGLAMLNIYPEDLLRKLFNPRVVKNLLGLKSDREKFLQLNILNQSVAIECPHYTGCRLSEDDHRFVVKHLKGNPALDLEFRKSLGPALTALSNALGAENVTCKFTLPHFKSADIVLAYDREKKCFTVPPEESSLTSTNILDKIYETKKIQKIAIVLLSHNQISDDFKPLGLVQFKIRQLKALDYEVIMVDAEEAQNFTCTDIKTTEKKLLGFLSATIGCNIEDLGKH